MFGSTVGMTAERWNNMSVTSDDSSYSDLSLSKKSGVMRRINRFINRQNPRENQTGPDRPQAQPNTVNVNLTFEGEGSSESDV